MGYLELSPKDFWRLTPSDINDLTEAKEYRDQLDKTDSRIAYMLANLMSPYMKKGRRANMKDFMMKWKTKKPVEKNPVDMREKLREFRND